MEDFVDTLSGQDLEALGKPPQAAGTGAQPPAAAGSAPRRLKKPRELRPWFPQNYKPVSWEHFLLTCDIVHSFQKWIIGFKNIGVKGIYWV